MTDERNAQSPAPPVRARDFSTSRWRRDEQALRVPLRASASIRAKVLLLGPHALSRGKQGKQFLHIATRAVRRMLVDQARVERAARCIGIDLPHADRVPHDAWERLLELDSLLDRLERADPRQAAIVEYRLFSHLTFADIAHICGLTTEAAMREWRMACAWLKRLKRGLAQ